MFTYDIIDSSQLAQPLKGVTLNLLLILKSTSAGLSVLLHYKTGPSLISIVVRLGYIHASTVQVVGHQINQKDKTRIAIMIFSIYSVLHLSGQYLPVREEVFRSLT